MIEKYCVDNLFIALSLPFEIPREVIHVRSMLANVTTLEHLHGVNFIEIIHGQFGQRLYMCKK